MRKENLILVHSFPTNSIILKGFSDYLNDYFNVIFIDLPGFARHTLPLDEVSLQNYAAWLRKKIKALELENYILGGVSFGFTVVNHIKPDKRCSAILAIEPYLNPSSLKMNPIQRIIYRILLKITILTGLSNIIWKTIFRPIFARHVQNIDIVLREFDPTTFFKTAYLIFSQNIRPTFYDLPYVLLINPDDATLNTTSIIKKFQQAKNLLVLQTTIDHYPGTMTKEYFRKTIPDKLVRKMIVWIRK